MNDQNVATRYLDHSEKSLLSFKLENHRNRYTFRIDNPQTVFLSDNLIKSLELWEIIRKKKTPAKTTLKGLKGILL